MVVQTKATTVQTLWPGQISPQIMEEYAGQFCKGSYLDPNGCGWYHANWKFLKALNLVSNPYWHAQFYLKHVGHVLAQFSFARILLCGTADDGLLSLLATPVLTLSEPRRVAITVLDACRTPLRVCDDFANAHGLKVITYQGDAQSLPFEDDSFDLILTDAFLTRFPSVGKSAVVKEWSRTLSELGRILTTTRVEADKPESYFARPSIPGIRDRLLYVIRTGRASALRGFSPMEMIRRAWSYSGHMASYPFRGISEVNALFDSAGLKTDLERGATGLREAEPRDYALICARKESIKASIAASA